MKSLMMLSISFVFTFSVFAQDNIVLKSGEEIKAKVQEVGISEVKYKKADNPNGPLYTTDKGQVLMIKYENGSKDVFGSSTNTSSDNKTGFQCQKPATSLTDYDRYSKLARRRTIMGGIMTGLGIHSLLGGAVLVGAGITQSYDVSGPSGGGMVFGGPMLVGAGLASAALGTALTIVGAINLSKATKYKKQAKALQQPTLGFAPIQNIELDRYTQGLAGQKFGSLTLTF